MGQSSWKKRYFVLSADHQLKYYEFSTNGDSATVVDDAGVFLPGKGTELGVIDLNTVIGVDTSVLSGAPVTFGVLMPTVPRVWELAIESASLQAAWRAAVQAILSKRPQMLVRRRIDGWHVQAEETVPHGNRTSWQPYLMAPSFVCPPPSLLPPCPTRMCIPGAPRGHAPQVGRSLQQLEGAALLGSSVHRRLL